MRILRPTLLLTAIGILPFAGCKPAARAVADAVQALSGKETSENITSEERAAAKNLKESKDPTGVEVWNFKLATRQAYNNRRFDELEKIAAEARAGKTVFENGCWKIAMLYDSFGCDSKEPESMWQLHDRIHQDWIAAKPTSITARVAYADFLNEYAWHARGTEYADKVTQDGWKLFAERLEAALQVLMNARALPEKDPAWWTAAMTVALGQSWSKPKYDALVAEAHAFEPKYWSYDTARAYSLLPRWHGEPGDWELYALEAAALPDGLGAETYARIVMEQYDFYENIFRESKASWTKTKEGLNAMMRKYPKSTWIASEAANLAGFAEDRAYAQEMFALLGDTYLKSVWGKPERFIHNRNWAQTGKW